MSTRSRARPWFRDPREIPKPTPPERYELDLDVPDVTFTIDLDEVRQAPLSDRAIFKDGSMRIVCTRKLFPETADMLETKGMFCACPDCRARRMRGE